jgi:hypothetical protein
MVTECLLFVTRLRTGRSGVRILRGWGTFLFSKTVQTAPGAHPASYSIDIGVILGLKLLERDAAHSPPPSAQVRRRRAVPLLPLYVLMAWTGINVTFILTAYHYIGQPRQYATAMHSTVQYRKVHYSTIRYNTLQYTTVQFTSQHITVKHITVQ